MTRYIIRRLLEMLMVLLGVLVAVFLMLKLTPGDPASAILGVMSINPFLLVAGRVSTTLAMTVFLLAVLTILICVPTAKLGCEQAYCCRRTAPCSALAVVL